MAELRQEDVTWRPRPFGAQLAENARRWPEAEAFVCGETRLAWAALERRARRAAAKLIGLGIRPGDHVAVLLPNGADWAAAFWGIALAGAVTVPVNTRFRTTELRYCLGQSDARALVMVDRFLGIDFAGMLAEARPDLPLLEHVVWPEDLDAPEVALPEVDPRSVALIQYTSGTTALPKGAMLTHDSMLRNASAVARRIGIRPDDRYFSARPYYHVAGTTLSILAAASAGACLITQPTFEAGEALDIMERERATLTSGNDTLFLMMMSHPSFPGRRLSLRGGWAAAGEEVMRQIHDRMGMRAVVQCYGLSEASPNVICNRFDDPLDARLRGAAVPHEGMEVRLSETGEILVRGWSVMRGYYRKPEETSQAIDAEGWLHTGDLGRLEPDGRLRFVGRAKDVFRVGGENVAPAEVEEVLHGHPAVKQAQVIGVPDARLGEVPAAYVVLNEGMAATADELIRWCKARIAGFRVPRYLKLVDGFEGIGMTGSGKVQKNRLRELALADFGLSE